MSNSMRHIKITPNIMAKYSQSLGPQNMVMAYLSGQMSRRHLFRDSTLYLIFLRAKRDTPEHRFALDVHYLVAAFHLGLYTLEDIEQRLRRLVNWTVTPTYSFGYVLSTAEVNNAG